MNAPQARNAAPLYALGLLTLVNALSQIDRSLDEAICVEDGDVVMVPRGYHPVGAPHGYDLYYLNVMAGPKRVWRFHNDPAHEWLMA